MSTSSYYNKKEYTKVGGFRKKAILAFVKKDKASILDIGCSDGEMGEILKREKHARVVGIDISRPIIEKAKEKIDEAYVVDIDTETNSWPEELKQEKFDYIIISEVLEHLLEPEALLEKIKIFIHKETEILITVPNLLFWKNRIKILFGKFKYEDKGLMDKGHVHIFSWESFKDMIWGTGFDVVEINNHIPTRGTKRMGRLFPGLFAYQFVVKIKRKRKVIYTAIFGGKDDLIEPKYLPTGFDFVCFSDRDHDSKFWRVIKEPGQDADPVRSAKIYKILPHKYLTDYEISIWIDGNKFIKGDVNELLEKYLKNNSLAIYSHDQLESDPRNCVYEEVDEILKMAERGKVKDDPIIVKKQIEKYSQENYPHNNGLISGMVILRRHNDNELAKVMEDWWTEIQNGSRRDQISFNYVAWKNNFKFVYMQGDSRNNEYFGHVGHKK